jgi:predicted Zn-dependent protease
MAHEMAHVTRRHVAQLYRRSRNTGIAAALAGILAAVFTQDPTVARAGSAAADLAATAYLGTFTREAEREADRVAIATLIRAGIEPRAMVEFFELLAREQAGHPRPPPFLSSHPTAPERIAAARAEIARHGELPPMSRGDTRRFRNVQRRLAGT